MTVRVGFPATLTYFSYYPFWLAFFTGLGQKLVASPPTSKGILDAGVREAVSDACVPIKLVHGHVIALKDQVELLFIPRMVSVARGSTFCPKFLGLPDMLRYCLEGLPPILDHRINLARGKRGLWKVCRELGAFFGSSYAQVRRAYRQAVRTQRAYRRLLLAGWRPQEAFRELWEGGGERPPEQGDLNLAVLGYPYQVYDSYINVNLLKNLERMGVRVWTMEMVPEPALRRQAGRLRKDVFWHYSRQVIWATYYYLERPFIDGIIHVTAFGCGPDAMVDKVMELDTRAHGRVPFLSLSIDEHTGEAGLVTRLEAFVDMIRFRKEKRL